MAEINTEVNSKILRVQVNHNWSINDLSDCLKAINYLYDLCLIITVKNNNSIKEHLALFSDIYDKEFSYIKPIKNEVAAHLYTQFAFYQKADVDLKEVNYWDLYKLVQLQLHEIQISSPGHFDLAGLGEVVKQLKELLFGIIDRYQKRKHLKLEREEKAANTETVNLKNTEMLQNIIEKTGLTRRQKDEIILKTLQRQDIITQFIEEEKIVRVKIIDSKIR